MAWESATRQFGAEEMERIETLYADEVEPMIANSDPLVTLSVLTELSLHQDIK